ncbi:hypothetical protein SY83_01355 [Paenibacillus swuensis]|uniref:Transporter n=1 Tax=Paenibacillus swuensis TaxID=1178515 RepID=A0A172TE76_9BACL|nr:hypothetical protein [Paenibacillus swuensis]ANE45197.1 hypothetical protein SY83_01355 [Paenibacillus swuensis]
MQPHHFNDYIATSLKIGTSAGAVLLLTRTFGNNAMLLHPEGMIRYGLVGGIGYGIMGAIAYLLLGMLARRVKKEAPSAMTIGDYMEAKLQPFGFRLMLGLVAFGGMLALYAQGVAVLVLLKGLFPDFYIPAMMLFLLLCLLYAGMAGMRGIQRISILQISVMFTVAIALPVYFYIRDGIEHIYSGMRLYHPYLLVFSHNEGFMLIAAGLAVGLGHALSDRFAWQQLLALGERKVTSAFVTAGLIGAIFPLVLASIAITSIYSGLIPDGDSLVPLFMDKVHSPFLAALFIAGAVSALSALFGTELQALVSLLVRNIFSPMQDEASERQKVTIGRRMASLLVFAVFASVMLYTPPLPELIFFLGLFHAALVTPLLVLIWQKDSLSNLLPLCAMAGMIAGCVVMGRIDGIHGIVWSLAVSGILAVAVMVWGERRSLYGEQI